MNRAALTPAAGDSGGRRRQQQQQQQQRRRSARLSSPPASSGAGRAAPAAAAKRSIAVRKIVPRKTVAPSDHDKENVRRLSGGDPGEKPKVSTPDVAQAQAPRGKQPAMPSPILASPPPLSPPRPRVSEDPADSTWSRKVRRSYSRLADRSVDGPDAREDLFGFDTLQTPEVVRRVSKSGVHASGSLSGLSSFATLLDGDDADVSSVPEPDLNIPGVVVPKEKRRRRMKVQPIGGTELDSLVAEMNAEFEEAEGFELTVE